MKCIRFPRLFRIYSSIPLSSPPFRVVRPSPAHRLTCVEKIMSNIKIKNDIMHELIFPCSICIHISIFSFFVYLSIYFTYLFISLFSFLFMLFSVRLKGHNTQPINWPSFLDLCAIIYSFTYSFINSSVLFPPIIQSRKDQHHRRVLEPPSNDLSDTLEIHQQKEKGVI